MSAQDDDNARAWVVRLMEWLPAVPSAVYAYLAAFVVVLEAVAPLALVLPVASWQPRARFFGL